MSERIIICGDRNWTNKEVIRYRLKEFVGTNTVIIHGANGYDTSGVLLDHDKHFLAVRGADMLTHQVADELGLEPLAVPAPWDVYGRSAGSRRNSTMLALYEPTMCIGFHENLDSSKGTRDMLQKALRAGLSTFLVYKVGPTWIYEEFEYGGLDSVDSWKPEPTTV